MRIKKQLIDQSAHFLVGGLITLLLSFIVPVVAAAGLLMIGAVLREKVQHRHKTIFSLPSGSYIDLAFWLAGASLIVGLRLSGVF